MLLQKELQGPPPAFALEPRRTLPRRNGVKAGRIFTFSASAPKATAWQADETILLSIFWLAKQIRRPTMSALHMISTGAC